MFGHALHNKKNKQSSCSTFIIVCQTSSGLCRWVKPHKHTQLWFAKRGKNSSLLLLRLRLCWSPYQWSNPLCHLCSWWEQCRSHHIQLGRVDIFLLTRHARVCSHLCRRFVSSLLVDHHKMISPAIKMYSFLFTETGEEVWPLESRNCEIVSPQDV